MTDFPAPSEPNPFSVLFVCTANVCRSPMAEVLLKGMLEAQPEIRAWRVESAGVSAIDGFPVSENSRLAVEEYGLDLSGQRSQAVREELLAGFNLILVMEEAHRTVLRRDYPAFADRVHTLMEMVGKQGDVEDPYGSVLAAYRVTAEEISQILINGFDKIKMFASS